MSTINKNLRVPDMFAAFNAHNETKTNSHYSKDTTAFGIEYAIKADQEIKGKHARMEKLFPDINDGLSDIDPRDINVIAEFTSRGVTPIGTTIK